MIIGKVIGNIWATRKEESLNGFKFLVVKPIDYSSGKEGSTIVAVDSVGAGIGETVLVVKGSSARKAIGNAETPIDATIIGIIDEVELDIEGD
ncbi:ethanolamine utilization protein EutN [Anaerosalibacter bizertensis]|uniref:Ethanolamine utilization protein EutN n=1 Tax=Anaerosalibacter bizertensis TaxID=932217 RepID=A0A844FK21_9FIRM|nr:EutN/CcmL family microcompartment protein [Anaerosalibacter bizertensis]MBV1818487.1 EutN/CcmL family microcompartment protein [Bacteroidales bacterium MSK.15.36]HHV26285.1 EutN/CcmL family microcompartment protein [Tissierellia bacterium]MBU5293504.1 EutN/CcmL family microcompartment protein [Anaerosalibacter bizertensis]MCB5559584.1 EutN/CcmL family microcompartment protein [Anaerosalibacter bizertensis]MCG4565523.1 EutN/CcmL family microcompartment protein [Anaerosalibacter bizertensis]